jgi:hypothetical protein
MTPTRQMVDEVADAIAVGLDEALVAVKEL